MCWAFIDTWLMDKDEEAKKLMRRQGTKQCFLPARPVYHHSSKRRTRYVIAEPVEERIVEVKTRKHKSNVEGLYEYIPATDEKRSKSSGSKKSNPKEKPSERVNSQHRTNEWVYVPAESNKKSNEQSSHGTSSRKKRFKMEEVGTAVVGGDADEEYDHWPDDATQLSAPSAVSGYNSHNGLREFQYHPANEEKMKAEVIQPVPFVYQIPAAIQAPAKPQPPQAPAAPAPAYPQQYITSYSPYAPHMAYPAPAYYGYPKGGMPFYPPGYAGPMFVPAPPAAPAAEKKKVDKPKRPEPKKWQGRTKAEVEEDNMKIAKAEGAYDARKIEPVGLKADQMVWVVEIDGSPTLRAYATIKEFKGEWKTDPRFENSWFFVREKEEGKEEKK